MSIGRKMLSEAIAALHDEGESADSVCDAFDEGLAFYFQDEEAFAFPHSERDSLEIDDAAIPDYPDAEAPIEPVTIDASHPRMQYTAGRLAYLCATWDSRADVWAETEEGYFVALCEPKYDKKAMRATFKALPLYLVERNVKTFRSKTPAKARRATLARERAKNKAEARSQKQ